MRMPIRSAFFRLLFCACATLAGFTALAPAHAAAQAQAAAPHVLLKTSMGDIVIELAADKAPHTVQNFLHYVDSGQYKGTVFHRVIPGFMIQGGGFTADMHEKPTGQPIALETSGGLKNSAGTIAMARTSDPDSATAQFFINTVDNPNLDAPNPDGHGYAVFGHVVSGMNVVKAIEAVPTTSQGPMADVPVHAVTIESITRVR